MLRLWILLLSLHQGHLLMSVITGELGKPVAFKCEYSDARYSNARIKWYKQNFNDSLVLITTLLKDSLDPTYEEGFSSRFKVNSTSFMSFLIILSTIPEDEAMYHCAVSTWSTDEWRGTRLSFETGSMRTFDASQRDNIALIVPCVVLSITLVVTSFLIYVIKKSECSSCKAAALLAENVAKKNLKREGEKSIYTAAVFTVLRDGMGEKRNRSGVERERIFAAVKAFGMD